MAEDIYDEAFADGVGNWNLWVIDAHARKDELWQAMMIVPEARLACTHYARTRYLGLLTLEEVFARYRTLFVFTMDLDDDGFLSPRAWNEWSDKRIHAATELVLRDIRLDDERARPDWSFVRTPRMLRAVAAAKRRKLDWGHRLLVKYGSARHLEAALNEGRIRISPASSYDDPSLNSARRDAELERALTDDAFELTATLGRIDTMAADHRALYETTIRSSTDYYIFCLAAGYRLRLFDDFDADACIVITDPARFLKRLEEAAASHLPGWHFGSAFVRYIDPVQRLESMDRHEFAPFLTKHYRYLYQHEVRAAWLPPDSSQRPALDHLFVELGNLKDYCELIHI